VSVPDKHEEAETVAAIAQALTASETAEKLEQARAELTKLRRALSKKVGVEDELAHVKVTLSEERQRADLNEKRAVEAETRVGKLRKALVVAKTTHNSEIESLRADYTKALREARQDARATVVAAEEKHAQYVQRLIREHAELRHRVSERPHEPPGPALADKPPPALPHQPEPKPVKRWQDLARELKPAEDADPFHLRVYNMMTPLQQAAMAGLACGKSVAAVANWQQVHVHTMDRHLMTMCRWMRVDGEGGLAKAARDLFGIKP